MKNDKADENNVGLDLCSRSIITIKLTKKIYV